MPAPHGWMLKDMGGIALTQDADLADPEYRLVPDDVASAQRRVDARYNGLDPVSDDVAILCDDDDEETIARSCTVASYRRQLRRVMDLPKVEQKTEAWYAMRQGMITASDLAQALGKGKFGSVKQFYEKKCDDKSTSSVFNEKNPFFVWGHMFEPVAIDIYSRTHGVRVHEFGLIPHPHYDFFGASPDGITDAGVLLEIKCPLRRKITGDVPLQYYYQIQGQLSATELFECDYFEAEFEACASLPELADVHRHFEHWGVIVETSALAPGSVLPYHYLTDESDMDVVGDWIASFYDMVNVKYWVLRKSYVRRIVRDDALVEDALSVRLRRVWENIRRFKTDRGAYVRDVKGHIRIDTEPLVAETTMKGETDERVDISGWAFLEDGDA